MENKQYEWAGFKENVDMDELISKKAVIEAIERARANVGHNLERSIGKSIIEILDDVGEDVGKLPSALGTNLAEVGTDCISRQAAIDAFEGIELAIMGRQNAEMVKMYIGRVIDRIKALPSAEPQIIRCENCKHYKEWESEFVPNAVVTQCMADNFPIRKAIPDGWFCAGAERRTDDE